MLSPLILRHRPLLRLPSPERDGRALPDDCAAANGFGQTHLCEDEARLLYEVEYPAPPDMRVSGSWRLSAGSGPMPPPLTTAERRAQIARIRSALPESSRNLPRRCEWWGIPDRTLDVVLEHMEGGNTPRYKYPPPPAFTHRHDSSWTSRRMETATSSSSGGSASGPHSSGSPALLPVKPKPQETPLGRRTRIADIVINEPRSSSRIVRPKTESGLLAVNKEHLAMATDDDEAALKWARDDYVREKMKRQRRAL
ncbi:hypothetical protein D1007_55622 [Hordeum vulgare]|nr:hypothetical protein D1007_55622 [Hordeum vulgare]